MVPSGKLILVVEDNAEMRSIHRIVLLRHGFRVLEASNGAEAVWSAQEYLPDLVLMDLEMPLMTGWEAKDLLRKDERTAGIPVVALTGSHEHWLKDPVQQGFDGLIEKPYSPRVLLAEVERFLDPERRPVRGGAAPQSE